ncbi:hypothetical protein ACA910_005340 [Epithemia clementina (nom. ined.)]
MLCWQLFFLCLTLPVVVACEKGVKALSSPFHSSTVAATSSSSSSPLLPLESLHVLVLSEPSPITYWSGQTARFRLLLPHLAQHHPQDTVRLVTCEKAHRNPPLTCFDEKIPIHDT